MSNANQKLFLDVGLLNFSTLRLISAIQARRSPISASLWPLN